MSGCGLHRAGPQVVAAAVLFGIACSVEVEHLRAARRHVGVASVGLASQWVFMPAMACSFARGFAMEPHLAFALICIGCAPGGSSSNTLCYFAAGDQALSIFLTTVTNGHGNTDRSQTPPAIEGPAPRSGTRHDAPVPLALDVLGPHPHF